MISLVLRGKVPVSEDAVTAALLDIFRHHTANRLLSDILSKARNFLPAGSLPAFDNAEIQLWPQLNGREPDARVLLKRGGHAVCRLLVESKIGAGKTGEGDVDEDGEGDQLAAYLLAEAGCYPDIAVAILYLTHHAARPSADLGASADALRSAGREDLLGGLHWLSWRDVEELLHNAEPDAACSDVGELLRRVKLYRFNTFDLSERLPDQGPCLAYLTRRGPPAESRRDPYFEIGVELGPLDSREWKYLAGYGWLTALVAMGGFCWQYETEA